MFPLSHAVAVTGYVFNKGRFLLLNRADPPLIWTPPGGRLEPGEDPRSGVVREAYEETGLKTRVVRLVDFWFGEVSDRGPLLSLDFLLFPEEETPQVRLSEEHGEFCWSTLEDLRNGKPDLGNDAWCYSIAHFESVWDSIRATRTP